MSFYGIYSLVFIVETDMVTRWPATREGGSAMFGALPWLNRDLRGTKQLRAVSHDRERTTPTDLGLDPPGRIGGHGGQKAISNDG